MKISRNKLLGLGIIGSLLLGFSITSFAETCDYNVNDAAILKSLLSGGASPGKVICLAPGNYVPGLLPQDTFNVTVDDLTLRGNSSDDTILDGDLKALHVITVDDPGVHKISLQNLAVMNGLNNEEVDCPLYICNPTDPNYNYWRRVYEYYLGSFTKNRQGAGMYVKSADLSLDQVRFENNEITEDDQNSYLNFTGGAALHARDSNVVVNHSVFKNNRAESSPAIVVVGLDAYTHVQLAGNYHNLDDVIALADEGVDNGSLTITDSIVEDNSSLFYSGIAVSGLDKLFVKNSIFQNNISWSYGPLIALQTIAVELDGIEMLDNEIVNDNGNWAELGTYASQDILHTVIRDSVWGKNYAQDLSAGPYIWAVSSEAPQTALIERVSIVNNTAGENGGMGLATGYYSLRSSLNATIHDCNFVNNEADGNSPLGFNSTANLEIANFANAGEPSDLQVSITGTKFVNNDAAGLGGGLTVSGAMVNQLQDVSFTNNRAVEGAGIILGDGAVLQQMTDVKFTNNRASDKGGAISVRDSSTLGFMTNVTFNNNSAATGIGNNIYCEKHYGIGPLTNVIYRGSDGDGIYGCNSMLRSSLKKIDITGTSGSTTLSPVYIGFDGNYEAEVQGLVPATQSTVSNPGGLLGGGVAAWPPSYSDPVYILELLNTVYGVAPKIEFEVPPDSPVLRLNTFDELTLAGTDVDLHLVGPDNTLVASSGHGGSSNEEIFIYQPLPGPYTLYIHYYSTPNDIANVPVNVLQWVFPKPDQGNLVATAPSNVSAGDEIAVQLDWNVDPLNSPDQYMGVIVHKANGVPQDYTVIQLDPNQ